MPENTTLQLRTDKPPKPNFLLRSNETLPNNHMVKFPTKERNNRFQFKPPDEETDAYGI